MKGTPITSSIREQQDRFVDHTWFFETDAKVVQKASAGDTYKLSSNKSMSTENSIRSNQLESYLALLLVLTEGSFTGNGENEHKVATIDVFGLPRRENSSLESKSRIQVHHITPRPVSEFLPL